MNRQPKGKRITMLIIIFFIGCFLGYWWGSSVPDTASYRCGYKDGCDDTINRVIRYYNEFQRDLYDENKSMLNQ